jgi:hypothetical protein
MGVLSDYVQNPESLSKTREPLAPGFASGFAQTALRKTLKL